MTQNYRSLNLDSAQSGFKVYALCIHYTTVTAEVMKTAHVFPPQNK